MFFYVLSVSLRTHSLYKINVIESRSALPLEYALLFYLGICVMVEGECEYVE
jgi:hypothetical protein